MKQNDELHEMSILHTGDKCNGVTKKGSLVWVEEQDNRFWVVMDGSQFDDYDYSQAWIPKSISHIRFDIYGYNSRVEIPQWANIKTYPIKFNKVEELSNKRRELISKADGKRYIGKDRIEKRYIKDIVDKVRNSPLAKCSCGQTDIKCGCDGTIHDVEKFDTGRFDRAVCDKCGAIITNHGLHLLHVNEEGGEVNV